MHQMRIEHTEQASSGGALRRGRSGTRSLLADVMRGALAGTLATVPMTLVITAMNRAVPRPERRDLPPRQITEELAERSGEKLGVGAANPSTGSETRRMSGGTGSSQAGMGRGRESRPPAISRGGRARTSEDGRPSVREGLLDGATMAAHFAFGAATGAIYGAAYRSLRRPQSIPPYLAGTIFGLGVWTVSYGAALPALDLQRRPDERPSWRNTTMIAGHIVWGAALGWSEEALNERR